MYLRIHLFANLAEIYGASILEIPFEPGLSVADLRRHVAVVCPDLAKPLEAALVAVNRAYAAEDDRIPGDAEVGLIPPVGGGSDGTATPLTPYTLLAHVPIDVVAAYQLLHHPDRGGTVVFTGTVREWTQGKRTTHLTYDAYQEMAVECMQRIQTDLEDRYPGVRTVCWHRLGLLGPTEIAVLCGAAAPHRDVAFTVARALIDTVKRDVPIWKKENFADGTASWQENQP